MAVCAGAEALGGGALQYDRAAVWQGEAWRLLTGQMVHWTARMALVDLGAILLLCACLEVSGRRGRAGAAMGIGAALSAAAVHLPPGGPDVYRGSSGVAAALFVALSLEIVVRNYPAWARLLALLALSLFLVKAGLEWATGAALAAGDLPPGVRVTAEVHLLGGLGGAIAFAAARLLRARRGREAPGTG